MALVLSQADIRRLLPMDACMEAVAAALVELSLGAAQNPLRTAMLLPDRSGLLGMMPGRTAQPRTLGLKVIALVHGNHGTELDAHQGVVVLFDPERGFPSAVLEASELTAIRTAAASGVATRALAREDARVLALLGSGVQARSHLEAMLVARPSLEHVRVYSPRRERREEFARLADARVSCSVEAVPSAREAVLGADVVCTTTTAREPVLLGEWLAPGTHVNAVGACTRNTRELDGAAVARARLFADSLVSLQSEAGDFLLARAEGSIGDEHEAFELGAVLAGRSAGRRSPEEITLYESLGIAVLDLAAGELVVRRARAEGVGHEVDLAGRA